MAVTLPGIGPGQRLADRYRLLEEIGAGGMGRVYRARDERLDRDVAIKLIPADTADLSSLEARAAARLAHPGLVQVFDVGAEGGVQYIVMELVRGRSLREVLAARGRLSPREAAAIAAQVADALDHAHQHGVVHCDIKPRNIMLTSERTSSPSVKLLDFGIAHSADLTRTLPMGEVRGSAAYVAPEQVRGEPLDGRTDVYALGAVLYELLTGRAPFIGSSLESVVTRRLVADPVPPRALNPSIPRRLERVALTALARDPARRYQSAGQLRDALLDADRPARISLPLPLPPLLPDRRRLLTGLAAMLLLAGLALLAANRLRPAAPPVEADQAATPQVIATSAPPAPTATPPPPTPTPPTVRPTVAPPQRLAPVRPPPRQEEHKKRGHGGDD